MAMFELHIPPHFFDSANAENHFESVSERIAKAFLSGIMNISPLIRGDDKQGEPDYICGKDGYEVTFAISSSLIPQIKGIKALDGKKNNIEESLICAITDAAERKAAKTYSCVPALVIIAIDTLPTWYHSLYFYEANPFARLAWKTTTAKRNKLFRDLYEQYVHTNKLKNIYIIQPTFDGTFAFYDIELFAQKKDSFLTHVKASNPKAFPTYHLVDAGELADVSSFEIKIVNYSLSE
ncbi:MAG: hypothetical protein ACI4B8_00795 [Candidatus Gastranaerophilaceae bacterium]